MIDACETMSSPRGIWRSIRVPLIATAAYLFLSHLLIGLRTEQFVLSGLFSVLYLLSSATRRWILGFAIFIVFWILFDSMKAFPNYAFNTVHIADLYQWERSWFGIGTGDAAITPNEYFATRTSSALDLLSGLFYLCWMPVPLAFAAYLFATNKQGFLRFALTFLLVNLLGFVVYYIYPAAPPWYVEQYGFELQHGTPGNTAGLGRFDALTGTAIFSSLYAKSSNVFAAMPSLHAAYPLIVLVTGIRYRLGWINVLFAVITMGIWSAAVYSGHHYVLDVLAGILCALVGIVLFDRLMLWSPFAGMIGRYERAITVG